MNTPSPSRRHFLMLLALGITPALGAADRLQVAAISQKLMCICGCHQLLGACNMINCPNSNPMRAELAAYLDQGMTEKQVLAAFTEKYGTSVLSAPPASGFNLSAWITPFAALLVGSLAVVYFLRDWRKRSTPVPATPPDSRYSSRIEEELKNFTPED